MTNRRLTAISVMNKRTPVQIVYQSNQYLLTEIKHELNRVQIEESKPKIRACSSLKIG